MLKSLNYYKSLDYDIIIHREELDGEKWYVAFCNEFGINACHGIGDTQSEAVSSFIEEKDAFIEFLFEKGECIPEPVKTDVPRVSGTMTLRMAPWLHATLIKQAESNYCSLNQHINQLLAYRAGEINEATRVEAKIDALRSELAHQSKTILAQLHLIQYDSHDIYEQVASPKIGIQTFSPYTDTSTYEQIN